MFTYFIFVPEMVECILVYVHVTIGVDTVLKLERVNDLDLLELVCDFLRHALLVLLEVEEVLLRHLLVLKYRLQPLIVVDFFLRDFWVALRFLLLIVIGNF